MVAWLLSKEPNLKADTSDQPCLIAATRDGWLSKTLLGCAIKPMKGAVNVHKISFYLVVFWNLELGCHGCIRKTCWNLSCIVGSMLKQQGSSLQNPESSADNVKDKSFMI